MGFFKRLFGTRSTSESHSAVKPSSSDAQQAVLVHLDGTGLPDHVYAECDLATIEDRLIEALSRGQFGAFDGNEVGPSETTLFMYGPDAEQLFTGIETILRGYPLCQHARVEIRRGGPGAEAREVRL
jgi:hypothetical protein